MRASLTKSIAESPATQFDRYPKGSVVLCNACGLPIFKLDGGLALGQKMGRAASLFKPVAAADLIELAGRTDVDAGVRAKLATMTPEAIAAHLARLTEPKSGDPMICPACGGCFAQVLTVDQSETIDRAYVLEFLTIPPFGHATPQTGVRFDRGGWVH